VKQHAANSKLTGRIMGVDAFEGVVRKVGTSQPCPVTGIANESRMHASRLA
jgi:hypothetical protein